MRRSAWTIWGRRCSRPCRSALPPAAAVTRRRNDEATTPRPRRKVPEGQAGRQADRAVDGRRRSHRLRPDLLPDGLLHLLRDAAAALLVQARRRRRHGPGPRRGAARGLRGRQDRHGQDQAGRQVLAAVQPRGHVRRTSSTRSSAASSTPWPPASRRRTSRTSRARRSAPSRARRSPASRRRTTRRSCSSSSAPSAA